MSIGYFWDEEYRKEEKKSYSCHTCKYYGQSTSKYCRECSGTAFNNYEPGLNSGPVPEKKELKITSKESKNFWDYVRNVADKVVNEDKVMEKESCLNCEYDAATPHNECTNCQKNCGFHNNWKQKVNQSSTEFEKLCNRIKDKYRKKDAK